MSVIDVTEEVISEVDMNAEFTDQGLSVSIYVDDLEFKQVVNYENMALSMLEDGDKYPDVRLSDIADGFDFMVRMLRNGVNG
jgi:hypothetical protein